MPSLFGQMKFFFGAVASPKRGLEIQKRCAATGRLITWGKKSACHKRRDPDLERHSRELLLPIAPQLSRLVVVGWNSRMRTTAGIAIASHLEVWLNPALKGEGIPDGEVQKTLLHELAHLLAHHRHGGIGRRRLTPHGPEWREACRDLGIPDEARTHQLPFRRRVMRRRYRLSCPVCGESHDRVRAPRRRIACLSCCRKQNGGVYHERFRFLIIKLGPESKALLTR